MSYRPRDNDDRRVRERYNREYPNDRYEKNSQVISFLRQERSVDYERSLPRLQHPGNPGWLNREGGPHDGRQGRDVNERYDDRYSDRFRDDDPRDRYRPRENAYPERYDERRNDFNREPRGGYDRREEEYNRQDSRYESYSRNNHYGDRYGRDDREAEVTNTYGHRREGLFSAAERRRRASFVGGLRQGEKAYSRRSPRNTHESHVMDVMRSGANHPDFNYNESDPLSKGKYCFGYAELPAQVWEDVEGRAAASRDSDRDDVFEQRDVVGARRKRGVADFEDEEHIYAKRRRQGYSSSYGRTRGRGRSGSYR